MTIDYLTHPNFHNFNPFLLPSQQGGGGGIHVKTWFVSEALSRTHGVRLITNTSEIENNVVLIEPLRFRLGVPEYEEDVPALLKGLTETKAKKILFCTEKTILTFSPSLRNSLLSCVDVVTASCEYQKALMKYIGITPKCIVRDPISDIYLSPIAFDHKETQLVASGQISWYKNTIQCIEVFKRLAGVIKRVYIGSKGLWATDNNDEHSAQLEDEMASNSDEVIKEVPMHDLARLFFTSRFGLWVAQHDTTATAVMGKLMSGMLVTSARHGYATELPVAAVSGVDAQVSTIRDLMSRSDDELVARSRSVVDWCRNNVSYTVFHDQLTEALK